MLSQTVYRVRNGLRWDSCQTMCKGQMGEKMSVVTTDRRVNEEKEG